MSGHFERENAAVRREGVGEEPISGAKRRMRATTMVRKLVGRMEIMMRSSCYGYLMEYTFDGSS